MKGEESGNPGEIELPPFFRKAHNWGQTRITIGVKPKLLTEWSDRRKQ